ncbi:endonuclease domain-containing protein [Microbacterium phyllosphaerae]|uniref:endonuclease domain-containing protein n=1 Tax=Microbacterium phyllosphaerae TaxID=124798 RepID=UPI003D65E896
MDLTEWLTARGGIAHRSDAADHGFAPGHVRAAIRSGSVRRMRAQWVALSSAPDDLVAAAAASGRLTCVSLARHSGWWVPDKAPADLHLQVGPNAHRHRADATLHWGAPLVDCGPRRLTASVEDALAHIASCCSREDARVIWESAIRMERLDIEALRLVEWREPRSRILAEEVVGLSDSGLETIVVVRLSGWGVPLRQQVQLAGHRVDIVIGSHLVVQIDGYAHHSSSAQRGSDVAHDAELRLRGYTVLRFSYSQIVHGWEDVERTLQAAIARGLHLPPRQRR